MAATVSTTTTTTGIIATTPTSDVIVNIKCGLKGKKVYISAQTFPKRIRDRITQSPIISTLSPKETAKNYQNYRLYNLLPTELQPLVLLYQFAKEIEDEKTAKACDKAIGQLDSHSLPSHSIDFCTPLSLRLRYLANTNINHCLIRLLDVAERERLWIPNKNLGDRYKLSIKEITLPGQCGPEKINSVHSLISWFRNHSFAERLSHIAKIESYISKHPMLLHYFIDLLYQEAIPAEKLNDKMVFFSKEYVNFIIAYIKQRRSKVLELIDNKLQVIQARCSLAEIDFGKIPESLRGKSIKEIILSLLEGTQLEIDNYELSKFIYIIINEFKPTPYDILQIETHFSVSTFKRVQIAKDYSSELSYVPDCSEEKSPIGQYSQACEITCPDSSFSTKKPKHLTSHPASTVQLYLDAKRTGIYPSDLEKILKVLLFAKEIGDRWCVSMCESQLTSDHFLPINKLYPDSTKLIALAHQDPNQCFTILNSLINLRQLYHHGKKISSYDYETRPADLLKVVTKAKPVEKVSFEEFSQATDKRSDPSKKYLDSLAQVKDRLVLTGTNKEIEATLMETLTKEEREEYIRLFQGKGYELPLIDRVREKSLAVFDFLMDNPKHAKFISCFALHTTYVNPPLPVPKP